MENKVGYKRLLQSSYQAAQTGGRLAFPRRADGCRRVFGDGPAHREASQTARMATAQRQKLRWQ